MSTAPLQVVAAASQSTVTPAKRFVLGCRQNNGRRAFVIGTLSKYQTGQAWIGRSQNRCRSCFVLLLATHTMAESCLMSMLLL